MLISAASNALQIWATGWRWSGNFTTSRSLSVNANFAGRLAEAIRTGGPSNPETKAYLENYNRNSFFVAMVESAPGVENLESILAVEGIDAVFIGPHDLSVSYDLAEQYEHPKVQGAIETIIRTCAARNIPAGTQWWTPELVRRELAWGSRFVLYSNDLNRDFMGKLFFERSEKLKVYFRNRAYGSFVRLMVGFECHECNSSKQLAEKDNVKKTLTTLKSIDSIKSKMVSWMQANLQCGLVCTSWVVVSSPIL